MFFDTYIQRRMNSDMIVREANEPSCYRSGDERKALKRAKAARRAFRQSKGYKTDSRLISWLKTVFHIS